MKNFLMIICIFSFWLSAFGFAEAAVLYFEPSGGEYRRGDTFAVNARIDTENEQINAVEGTIIFPPDLLLFVEAREGKSLINLWIERPELKAREKVVFSGIVPGGYNGAEGLLFSLVFKANKEGSGIIKFRESRALLNDGVGSQAALTVIPIKLMIAGQGAGDKEQAVTIEDREAPESFRPEITQSPDAFEGKYFLIFVAQDKNSGIDRYEVREGSGSFIPARSPYVLINQKLDKKIFVKAVDKAGNERIEVLYPPNFRPWYKDYWILGIMIIVVAGILWKLKTQNKKAKTTPKKFL